MENQTNNELPEIAGYRSIKLDTEPGVYYWCACGRSRNQPFCDGSHRVTNFQPLRVEIKTRSLVKWCTCKRTETPPFCDHSHRELPGYTEKEKQ
ncbi:MAG: CDGSH iron-sulfur domain-containing protein [Bacteroidota bacterium]